MVVLGIESSCDETAAAVVQDGARILSSVVASQVSTHEKYGGVVPELASREHLKKIVPVVDKACSEAGGSPKDVDAIAVTEGPGLSGSLLVGIVYAKALASALSKPLVGVNHLEGHIHSVLLENKLAQAAGKPIDDARLPAAALVVSGGHTSLFRVEAHTRPGSPAPSFSYTLLGRTRDDAAGEAFDKVAKLLALGYPGGPIIDRLSRFGNSNAVELGRIKMKGNPLDFSFSGLKTAVLYRVRGTPLATEAEERRAWRKNAARVATEDILERCSAATLDLIASFQQAVVTDLVERTLAAAESLGLESIFVSGGVACNSHLRERFWEALRTATPRLGRNGAWRLRQVLFPSPALSTDNAAMIAAAGFFKLVAGERAGASLTAHATFPLGLEGGPADT